jgi:hypothetical protein
MPPKRFKDVPVKNPTVSLEIQIQNENRDVNP